MAKPVKVPGYRYLFRRGSVLIFRRGVPEYARAIFGKGEAHVSFDTGDLRDALPRWAEEVANFNALLVRAKSGRAAPALTPALRCTPANIEIEEAVRRMLADRLERNEVDRVLEASDEAVEEFKLVLGWQATDIEEGLKRNGAGPSLSTVWMAEALIEENAWDVEPNTPAYRHLIRTVVRSQREARDRFHQIIDSDPIKVVDDTFSPEQYRLDVERQRERRNHLPISLFDVFEGYVAERKPAPRTIRAWRRQLVHFTKFVGYDDAARITPKEVQQWKESLLTSKMADGSTRNARTVKDTYLSALRTVLSWAKENHHIPANPAADVRVRAPKRVRLRDAGFTDDEAALILKATDNAPPKKLSKERAFARRWVPWLCAYSGARVNEITQMRRQDVFQVDGIWVMLITPEAGAVKSGLHRTVPIHSAIINRGFVVEIADLTGPLFYDPARRLKPSDEITQPRKVGEHLAAWVREVGMDDPRVQPNHGWRHRFKSLARKYEMDAETREVIQGHAPRTEGDGYGTRDHIGPMLKAISLLP